MKIGDKVIFRLRNQGKPYVCTIVGISPRRRFPYFLDIKVDTDCVAALYELTPYTPLMEVLV